MPSGKPFHIHVSDRPIHLTHPTHTYTPTLLPYPTPPQVIPREFKRTIGEFQPQFAGYDQQDSQEFMSFLLDGLHEDLNRCKRKPFVAKIESKQRPDGLIASEAWRRYLLRNDSEIVDRAFGLLRSHVTCTNCGTESVTFDAFSSLSLPIPVSTAKPFQVYVHLLPVSRESERERESE